MNYYERPLRTMPTLQQVEAERRNLKRRQRFKKAMQSTVFILIVVAAIAVLIATIVMPVLQVNGNSMEPTLNDGEIILVFKTDKFKTGDLCSFYWQNKLLLKRVIGVAGDVINITDDGTVYVNGEALEEPYISEKALGECDIDFPYQVPEDRIFVLGDHRSVSVDSRSSSIGCIKSEQIVGRVLFRVWPPETAGIVS